MSSLVACGATMQVPFHELRLRPGAQVFNEGDPGTVAFLIRSGRLEIYSERDGQERRIATRGPGEIVGEIAVIDSKPRSASVRALESSHLVVIEPRQISERIEATDPVLRLYLRVALERYRESMSATRPSAAEPLIACKNAIDHDAAIRSISLEHDMRRAIRCNEFVVLYQPIVLLGNRALAGFEALIRWNHPKLGMLSPDKFLPVAEASGLITSITIWVLQHVAKTFPTIVRAAGVTDPELGPFVSINISGRDLATPSFKDAVSSLIDRRALPPTSIKLEVTESALMENAADSIALLNDLRSHGFGIAIDDFGTGYSSLAYLGTIPITTLKIDRSFVNAMSRDVTSKRIVKLVLALADDLNVPVVAEGIESEDDAATLHDMGCTLGQGYLFSKPLSFEKALEFVGASERRNVAGG